jgi:ribosomal-protein-alanine N-acetyltransferase
MRLSDHAIVLRELTLEDLEAVHRIANHPDVYRYQPFGPNTFEETQAYLEGVIEHGRDVPRTGCTLALMLRTTEELIGYASLWTMHPETWSAEIGYFLHPDHWGHGYATDAARLLIRFGFEELGCHRIWGTADPRNIGSRRVLEKAGMIYEGCLRDAMLIRDGWRDSAIYSVLEHEWRAPD